MKITNKIMFLVFCLSLGFMGFSSATYGDENFQINGSGTVYKAIDGDTFWINVSEKDAFRELYKRSEDASHFNQKYQSVKMRIGNIDTAESSHIDSSRNTKKGESVSRYVKKITESRNVNFVCWEIGYYSRPICSLDIDGIGDIGAHLIHNQMSNYIVKYGTHPFFHNEYLKVSN